MLTAMNIISKRLENQLFMPHKDKEDDVETRKERDSDEQN